MFIFYLAKQSSCEAKKALTFFLFISIWVALAILPIHINNSDETNKTITTILSVFPVFLTSFYLFVAFIYVAFNKNPDDDEKISAVALLLIICAWIVSWSAIYMIYWTWYEHHAFPVLPSIAEPYEAWEYFLGISAGIYSADQPATADAHMGSLALIIGLHSTLSIFVNILILATVIAMVRENISKKYKSSVQEDRGRSIGTTAYYSPSPFANTQYFMSVNQ